MVVTHVTSVMQDSLRHERMRSCARASVKHGHRNKDNSKIILNQFLLLCVWPRINPRLTSSIQNY